MPMPQGLGIIDLMLGIPEPSPKSQLRLHAPALPRQGEPRIVRFPGRVHVQGRAEDRTSRRLHRVHAERDGQVRHRAGADRRVARRRDEPARAEAAPGSLHRLLRHRPEPRHGGRCATSCACTRSSASRRSARFRAGCFPQVPINDKRFYPVYAKCCELDIPICFCVGVPGPRIPMDAQKVELPRRGLLVLPGAQVRDAPRRRAVDRARGEADAQVAEPLLLDQRLRAEVLPEGDHRLRQHARRRQDPVRRLLPDGALARAHLRRHAATCPFKDEVWPKFLRENAIRVFGL